MGTIEEKTLKIGDREVTYTLRLQKTDHNKRFRATVCYNGQTQDVSQNLLVSELGSDADMRALADVKVMQMHREQFGSDEDENTVAKSIVDEIIEETESGSDFANEPSAK